MTRLITSITTTQIQEAYNPVINSFESDQIPVHITNALKPQNKVLPSAYHSIVNRVVMLSSGTADGRTYHQWKQAGRTIVEGSQPIYILSPIPRQGNSSAVRGCIPAGYSATILYRREDTYGKAGLPADVENVFHLPLKKRAAEWGIQTPYSPSNRLGFTCYTTRSRCLNFGRQDELKFLQLLVDTAYSYPKIPPRSLVLSMFPEVIQDLCIRVLGQMMRKKYQGATHDSYRKVRDYALWAGYSPEFFCAVVIKEVNWIIQIILKGRGVHYDS